MATKFTQLVTVNAPSKDVVFNGVDFTKDALVKIVSAASVTFKNCRFYGLNPNAAKTFGLIANSGSALKLVIENCFFGDNPAVDTNVLYNLMELNAAVSDGTSVSNNYFTKACCTHNQINMYDAGEEAIIKINGNYTEYSANMVRLGLKGSPKCTIMMENNTYLTTDASENGDYAGLCLIQPYSSSTVSFNDMVVKMNKTVNRSGDDQLIYIYAAGTDTKFNKETNYPKVYIDDVLLDKIPHPASVVVDGEETA